MPAVSLTPIVLSEPQTLPDFVKAHANTFPLTALVTSGYQSDDGDVEISCNEVLHIHSLHTTPVILAMNENRPIPPIPLTTETPFSVVYNPNNDRKKAMQGFVFSDVSSLLSLPHPPKVVCVTKKWTGDSTTISKGEILVINKHIVPGPHVAAGIVTFSISKMVEKFLPEECDGYFSTTPKLIQMSLENIFAYISIPFPSEVYTQQLLEHLISGFLYLTGCDIIQYLVYSSKDGEIESGKLPVHLPDVKLCLIMDSTLPKSIRSMDVNQNEPTDVCDALKGAESMDHQTPKLPPRLPPKAIPRNNLLIMPKDSSAMTPRHTAIQPPMENQPPPLPPKQKHKVQSSHIAKATYSTKQVISSSNSDQQDGGDFGVSRTCSIIQRLKTSDQFNNPSNYEEILVQDEKLPACAPNAIQPDSSGSFKHSCPRRHVGALPNISDEAYEPVMIEPGMGIHYQKNKSSSVPINTRDDTSSVASSTRQTHDFKAKSQTLHHHHQWSPDQTSPLPSRLNPGGLLGNEKTAADNMASLKSPTSPSARVKPGLSLISANNGSLSALQRMMSNEHLLYPMGDVPPPRPPPYRPDPVVRTLASKPQGKSLKYYQDASITAEYCKLSEPLTLNQFVSQYSDQLPVSIHVTAAAGLISGPKYLYVTALKNKEVVIAEDYTGKQLEVLLMSSKRFALLYGQTNIEDMKGTLQGQTLNGVSDFLKLKNAPKVFCVTKSWKDSVMSIDENEILIVQSAQREGVKKGIVVFSVLTRTLKFLPRVCTAHFSTNAVLLGLPMVDLIGYVPNLFPCSVCSVIYGNTPKCYPVDVITLKEVATTSVLECVPMCKGLDNTQEATVLSIPVGLPTVEVVIIEKLRDSNAGLTGENLVCTKNSVSPVLMRTFY